MGKSFTLIGSLAVPPQRFCVVLRYTPTIVVHDPEIGLGLGVTLLRSLAVPPHCCIVVLCHTLTSLVHDPQVVLGTGVTLVGKLSKYSYRHCVVATIISTHSRIKVRGTGRHASNKQGNGYKTDSNFLASHTFIPLSVSTIRLWGRVARGGKQGLFPVLAYQPRLSPQAFGIRLRGLSLLAGGFPRLSRLTKEGGT